ncbi:putative naringenin-chalcone synthase [Frankia canadensis]|uniref:Putative naringenin-chalcone synthase n=1 Tax=Frankia canadensis TaxID=1836972 RepID=A0A2I2KRM8_9ACTN|nr:type III polyketide synthase [Frankia canadensis]SNQ48310.1 putative naringenin-chalcone synthase [Frankia canadensis]SOU55600.1 putative naringenin-chalcone synthase [Frankia canadensis]
MVTAAPSAAVITGLGSAFPDPYAQQSLWDDYFAHRYRGDALARRLFLGSGVRTRHSVVDPRREDISDWSTAARMRRYLDEAPPLGRRAAGEALADAGIGAAEVGLFVVVSCTGYATPGLDIHLARELGMEPSVRRLLIGHMGCYAAIPGLGAAADFVRARRQPALVLCVELTSLHVQPAVTHRDLEQVIAHALFGDAAVAVVVLPDAPHGLEILDTTAATAPASEDLMTWHITDHGFRMGLSPQVPDVLAKHVEEATAALLVPIAADVTDVGAWAVHPGGPRIVDVVEERLGLRPGQTAATRRILDTRGNCSSGTVLLVLDQLRRGLATDATVVAMAFGPGLTLCLALLRAR